MAFAVTRQRAALILFAAVALAYAPSLGNGFVFDDAMFVRDDPRLRTLGEAPRLFVEPLWGYLDADGVRHLHQYYRPLQTLPLALLRPVAGEAAWPAHLLNLLLHTANALLVFSIFAVLLGSSATALALALLWAVHPAYSEAVLWVSNLAGLGAALAILAILRLHLAPLADAWAGRVAVAGALLLGLLFHEIAIIAPLLLVAFELIAAPACRWRRLGMELLTCVPVLGIYAWLRWQALGGAVPGLERIPMTLPELLLNGVGLLPQYASTFFWPLRLNMYHDFDPVGGAADAAVVVGIAFLMAGAALFVAARRRQPLGAFAVVWIGITTLPYLVIRWPQLNVFAERYLYLPAIGFFLLAGAVTVGAGEFGAAVSPRRSRWIAAGVVALLTAAGVLIIWQRTPDWRDDVTLYSKTLTQSRRALLIRNNLAVRLLEQQRYDEGIDVLEEVAETPAATSDTWHNLGLLRAAAGDERGAVRAFRRASRYGVPKLSTVLNLGYMYDRVGERRDAVETYFRLLDRAPDYTPAWFNLAMIAFETGQYDNARAAVRRVLELSPDDREAATLQRRLQAISEGVGAAPTAADEGTLRACRQAMRDARRGRYREAMIRLRAAAWLDESRALPHQYLANIAALRSDYKTALDASRAALARAPGNPLYRRNIEVLEKKLAEGGSR